MLTIEQLKERIKTCSEPLTFSARGIAGNEGWMVMVDPERKKRAIKEAQESFDRGISLDNRKFRCEVTGYDGLYFEAKFKKEGVELTKEILKDPVLDCHPRINQCSELKDILDGIEKKIFQKRYRKNGMEKLVKEGDLNEIIIG